MLAKKNASIWQRNLDLPIGRDPEASAVQVGTPRPSWQAVGDAVSADSLLNDSPK
jgi:hypothetical protein